MDISLIAMKIIISILYIFSFKDPRYAVETFRDPISNIPTFTTAQLFGLTIKDHGMVIYNTDTNTAYTWSGKDWIPISNRILFSSYIDEPSSVTYQINVNGLLFATYCGDCVLFNSSNSDGIQKNNIIFQYHNERSGKLLNLGTDSTKIQAIYNGIKDHFYVMKLF